MPGTVPDLGMDALLIKPNDLAETKWSAAALADPKVPTRIQRALSRRSK
jgi:hypothetical protein